MTELKFSTYAVSRTISDYGDLTAEERARLHNHLRCIREGEDLWLFDSPDAGWELMTRGGEGWINLKETGLANLLLQELSFNSRSEASRVSRRLLSVRRSYHEQDNEQVFA